MRNFDYAMILFEFVKYLEFLYNHESTPERFVHLIPNYPKLTEADKQVLNVLHSPQGVGTCHIVSFLIGQKGGHEGLAFIRKDQHNYKDH
ncbi:hypothetical protein TSUD_21710 [Trifolium subterraneum]|uniref:Uncharacterized protein n=1 Tax=Trifolium subterraneum TaxID=3900 RepID=A0A2Z6M8M0_TRISU|nr:hypothetical protein TSUD_21710 [Trifolium subterraneum]